MDYSIFIKNKFLNRTVGDFSSDFEKVDYKEFEHIVSKNTVLGMGKIAMKICRGSVKSVFYSVDGIPINQGNGTPVLMRKDGFVDKDEMYQLLKESYKSVKGEDITEEEISKLSVKQAIDLVISYWDKKQSVK